MTPVQEEAVLDKCIDLVPRLQGRKAREGVVGGALAETARCSLFSNSVTNASMRT
jgi:hypothetical protein